MSVNETGSSNLRSLSYRRYTVVNIRKDETLTPHLCVLVDDDEAFQTLKQDPHYQLIITSTGEPVKRGAYVPLSLTVGHTFPATEEQLAADEAAGNAENFEVQLEGKETLAEVLFGNTDLPEGQQLNTPEGSDTIVEEFVRPDLNTYFTEGCIEEDFELLVPTAFINLSHLIFEAYSDAAPAFLLASNKTFQPGKAGKGYDYEDFDFVVEYEDPNNSMYDDSVAELMKIREGSYIVSPSGGDMGNAAAVLLDKIVRIAAGEISAVHEAIEFMGDFARLTKKAGDDSVSEKPKAEDTMFHTMLNFMIDLYDETSTEKVFNTLYDSEVLTGFEDSVEDLEEHTNIIDNIMTVEKLFESQGLSNLFDDIDISPAAPKLPDNAKEADFAVFYSTPLTESTFPDRMVALAKVFDFDFIYENNILDNDYVEDIEITSENAESILLAMLVGLAVRYNRMKELQQYGLPFIPFNVFLKVFQDMYESNFVSDVIMFSIVNIPSNGTTLLRELATSHMAAERQDRVVAANNNMPGTNMPVILTFPSVIVLHFLNHIIFDDELNLEALSNALRDENPLKEYVEGLDDSLEELREKAPFGPEACPELLMSVNWVVGADMSPAEIADSVIDLLVCTGELSITTNTDFVRGSDEWKDYLTGFYQALIQK